MIKNLKADENNWFLEGTFDSDSLFQGEMSVSIFTDDGATIEDASLYCTVSATKEKCCFLCKSTRDASSIFSLYV